jgi:hypothetical protein
MQSQVSSMLPLAVVSTELILCLAAFLRAMLTSMPDVLGALFGYLCHAVLAVTDHAARQTLSLRGGTDIPVACLKDDDDDDNLHAGMPCEVRELGAGLILPAFLSKSAVLQAIACSANKAGWSVLVPTARYWIPTGHIPEHIRLIVVGTNDMFRDLTQPSNAALSAHDPLTTLIERACASIGIDDLSIDVGAAHPCAVLQTNGRGYGAVTTSKGAVCCVLTAAKSPFFAVFVDGEFFDCV